MTDQPIDPLSTTCASGVPGVLGRMQVEVDGGPTSLDNLILLCGHHHRLVHAAPWSIRRAGPREFLFDPPHGIRRQRGRPPPDG